MKDRWQTIEDWLARQAPQVKENLNPPATQAEILAVEDALGVRFPPSVRETYLIHDGESRASDGLFGLWRLLPLQEVRAESEELSRLAQEYGFDDFKPGQLVPILSSSGDYYYCVESSAAGQETPVVEWEHERPSRAVVAASFAVFVDAFVERLNHGAYIYRPDELQGLIDVKDL